MAKTKIKHNFRTHLICLKCKCRFNLFVDGSSESRCPDCNSRNVEIDMSYQTPFICFNCSTRFKKIVTSCTIKVRCPGCNSYDTQVHWK
jgi:DNA-directed RNA polymerase subunit RPC12/RpoP